VFAVGIGAKPFEHEHEETIAIVAGDGGGDFLTLAIDVADVFGALHGAAADFKFGGVSGLIQGGIPLFGEGLGFEEGSTRTIVGVAGVIGSLAGNPGVVGGTGNQACFSKGAEK